MREISEYISRKNFSKFLFFLSFCLPSTICKISIRYDANKSSSYDGSGTVINDLNSSGNDLKIVNDVTHVADPNGFLSFKFGGSSDYLRLNSAPFNDLSDGTNFTIVILINLLVSIFQV